MSDLELLLFPFFLQFVILVIDSTDRERLHVSKAELYNMLANEVRYISIKSLFLKEFFSPEMGENTLSEYPMLVTLLIFIKDNVLEFCGLSDIL